MICPACGNGMTEIAVGDVKVDACKNGCGGLWFDNFELRKLDEPSESAGEQLVALPRAPAQLQQVDRSKPLRCPKDPGIMMMRHFWSVKRQVTVDECPQCRGVFLDPGELATIRGEYATEGERHQAADAYFQEMFGTQLTALRQKDQQTAERAQHFARMFRFICPSYYLPGKQSWGAF